MLIFGVCFILYFLNLSSKNGLWYIGVTDSESRLRFLKFRPENPFLGKFGTKNSKLSVLSKTWYTWYLKNADSYSSISFLNFKF